MYVEQLRELVSSLEAMPEMVVRHAEIGAPASRDALATARTYAAYRLPTGVQEFYAELNGFRLEWEYREQGAEGETTDQGAIQLLPVERIFGSWQDVTWFDDFEGGDRFRAVKPFDFIQPEACAAFYQEPDDEPRDEVYVHYLGEALCSTGYSFPDYVERLIATRGYHYWQLALCPDAQANPEVRRFHERMPALFPDFRAALFVPGPPRA